MSNEMLSFVLIGYKKTCEILRKYYIGLNCEGPLTCRYVFNKYIEKLGGDLQQFENNCIV